MTLTLAWPTEKVAAGAFTRKAGRGGKEPALVLQWVRRRATGLGAFLLLLEGQWEGGNGKRKGTNTRWREANWRKSEGRCRLS